MDSFHKEIKDEDGPSSYSTGKRNRMGSNDQNITLLTLLILQRLYWMQMFIQFHIHYLEIRRWLWNMCRTKGPTCSRQVEILLFRTAYGCIREYCEQGCDVANNMEWACCMQECMFCFYLRLNKTNLLRWRAKMHYKQKIARKMKWWLLQLKFCGTVRSECFMALYRIRTCVKLIKIILEPVFPLVTRKYILRKR